MSDARDTTGAELGELFGSRIAKLVADAIRPAAAAELRAELERAGYTRFALVDRGAYDVIADPRGPAASLAIAAAAELATRITGRTLVVVDARALRLRAGDYILAHHDRTHDDRLVEVTLDVSAARVPDADVHYRRAGEVTFVAPSTPTTAAVVERDATASCNHVYVSKRHAGAQVVRLVVRLRDR